MSVMDVIAILGVLTALSAAVMQYMSNERIPLSLDSDAWVGLLINIIFFALFAVFSFGYDRQLLSLHIIILMLSPFVVDWLREKIYENIIDVGIVSIFGIGIIHSYYVFIAAKICKVDFNMLRLADKKTLKIVETTCPLYKNSITWEGTIPLIFLVSIIIYGITSDEIYSRLMKYMNFFLSLLLIMITCGIGLCLGWLVRLLFF